MSFVEDEEEEEGGKKFIAELAKSGAALCRQCETKIQKGLLRIGKMIEGDWGLQTRWYHIDCICLTGVQSIEDIGGAEDLKEEHLIALNRRIEESKEEVDDEGVPIDPDTLVRQQWSTAAEPPSSLLMPLLPYQKEGLAWMLHQEVETDMLGGILADEMGMGKTIQAISLLLANRPAKDNALQAKQWQLSDERSQTSIKPSMRGGTLIVLPVIAMGQWQSEIARFTSSGALKVKVFHGNHAKSSSLAEFRDADVVLTSYKTLEAAYRKQTAGTKLECRICGKKFYAEKLRVHRMYFCGETSRKTEAQAKQQKKKARVNIIEHENEDVDNSEDEIDRQKKLIKGMKEGKVQAAAAKKKGGRGGKGKEQESVRAVEDEIDRQKRLIKELKEKEEVAERKNLTPKGTETKKRTPNQTASKKYLVEEEGGKEEQDEVGIGRRKVPRVRTSVLKTETLKENSDADEDDSDYDNDVVASTAKNFKPRVQKSRQAKATVGNKRRRLVESSDDSSDEDFEISNSVSGSSDDDEDDDNGGRSVVKESNNKRGQSAKVNKVSKDADEVDEELERDIARAMMKAPKAIDSPLHQIAWFRVILDEAHMIKDRSTSTAHAVFALEALYKWCLTGTPLQNRVGELYSLIRFLRIDPHAYYYCKRKGCECKSLHYRFFKGKCLDCDHTAMQHYCNFNKYILNPIKRCGYIDEGKKAMLRLKTQVLDQVMLRRTKTSRADDIQLPMRIVRVRQECMSESEEDFYQALYTQSHAQFNTYVQSGTVLNNYAHIFDILIRLRQAVNHPYLVIHSQSSTLADYSAAKPAASLELELCGLCGEEPENAAAASCGHSFCQACLMDYLETGDGNGETEKCCPLCNNPLTVDLTGKAAPPCFRATKRKGILARVDLSKFQSSSKIEALMQELQKMRAHDLGAKAIVFSQFVSMLDLIEHRLTLGGVGCVKLQGSMNVELREKNIAAFKNDLDVNVLLISLKAGGVALNLTVANYIFLMDPWWNPAAEMQAIDRTHRLGQHKPIYATRFIAKNTIEDRILRLQEKKKLVFDGTVGGDSGSMARLTVDDMRFLFH